MKCNTYVRGAVSDQHIPFVLTCGNNCADMMISKPNCSDDYYGMMFTPTPLISHTFQPRTHLHSRNNKHTLTFHRT